MGIIAWIVLGPGAGLLANMLIAGRRSRGLDITCLTGVAGALPGGHLVTSRTTRTRHDGRRAHR
jgi:uncharacterized membrane protein YeaQ/YmgE (transglycosylase-associated protein family)